MILGYARTTSDKTSSKEQLTALAAAGCDRILKDRAESVGIIEHDSFQQALSQLKRGDTLVVWRMDRIARSMSHLVNLLQTFNDNGIIFKSLVDQIDTQKASGRQILTLAATLADFERSTVGERNSAGRAAAASRGVKLGRKSKLDQKSAAKARRMLKKSGDPDQVASFFKVSRATLYRAIGKIPAQTEGNAHA